MSTINLTNQLLIILNQFLFLEKRKKFVFEGISLYPSEIHLMLETNGDQAVNATKIAEKLGITKGAVSQTITRLENKGIIQKIKDPYYKNELSIKLTPQGKRAYGQYQNLYTEVTERLNHIISRYTPNEKEIIAGFLSDIEAVFKVL